MSLTYLFVIISRWGKCRKRSQNVGFSLQLSLQVAQWVIRGIQCSLPARESSRSIFQIQSAGYASFNPHQRERTVFRASPPREVITVSFALKPANVIIDFNMHASGASLCMWKETWTLLMWAYTKILDALIRTVFS